MSFTKEEIYNLALSALLLSEQVTEISTSKSNNISILNQFWNIALQSTLQDLDLDSTSTPVILELIDTIDDDENYPWDYVYKYPSDCAFFRRIYSGIMTDNKSTHIAKCVGMYEGRKAIFTNQPDAVAEIIPKDVPYDALNAMGILAVAYQLAILSAPLLVGKGAKKLTDTINANYVITKMKSQETDRAENFVFEPEWQRSEYVETRLS